MTTEIEWTDETWNPVTGCTKVSPGCDHCYAERITERFNGKGSFERVELHPERLEAPLHWRRPRRVFVNSMSDLFHASVPWNVLGDVWDVMRDAPQHTFQILTKRAERMERWGRQNPTVPHNVWLGVSVESPEYYARIRHLQRTPAAVRFLSCEPLLAALPKLPLEGISWVIVGGESGPGARPMHPDWVRGIREQCRAAGVAFFFKQWGEWQPLGPVYVEQDSCPHGPGDVCDCADVQELINERVLEEEDARHEVRWLATNGLGEDSRVVIQPYGRRPCWVSRVGKKRAGALLDGRLWREFPDEVTVRINFLSGAPPVEDFRLTGFRWEPGHEIEYIDETIHAPRP